MRPGGLTMHWMDRLVVAGSRSERIYPRLFPGGWGDDSVLDDYREPVRSLSPSEPVDLDWVPAPSRAGFLTWEASFPSPALFLPEAARVAHLLMVSPVPQPSRIVLLMAALNDHGFSTRFALARHLARLGIASVLLENPFYGKRRTNLHKQATRTVLDLLVMGKAATLEGVSVLDVLRRSSDARLGVSGYSMGGNIAALVGSVNPFPIALAPLAPPHSPAPVFAQGVLSRTVKWGSLGGPHRREDLGKVLSSASALHFPAPPHAAYAVLAAPEATDTFRAKPPGTSTAIGGDRNSAGYRGVMPALDVRQGATRGRGTSSVSATGACDGLKAGRLQRRTSYSVLRISTAVRYPLSAVSLTNRRLPT